MSSYISGRDTKCTVYVMSWAVDMRGRIHSLKRNNRVNTVKLSKSNFERVIGTTTFHLHIQTTRKCHGSNNVWQRLLTPLTWDLCGELGDDRGPVALGCASAQGEGVRGAWVEACEHVGGLVAQLHYLPTLVGEVQLRVKGTHSLIGDLK